MADNVQITPGTGTTIATDDVGGVQFQKMKLDVGGDGVTVPISATSDGRIITSDQDYELGTEIGSTGLRDRLFAQRYTVLADSIADGIAAFWTSTTASGGTTTSTGGEGLIQTSANATGSAQITSSTVNYYPGQVSWMNSAVRFGDTGSAGNVRRIGVFTVSGTTPQDGFYFELNGTTLSAVAVKAGVVTSTTASTSWTRVAIVPFTLDTNYHSFEIRFTANSAWFYVDNVLRHSVGGTSTPLTATLNFPLTIASVNTSGATNRLIAVRNIGFGRFGSPNGPEQVQSATTTNMVSSTSNAQFLAANSARRGVLVYNASTQNLYIKFGTTASIGDFALVIPPNGLWEMALPIYTGRIDGIWGTANGFARITELM